MNLNANPLKILRTLNQQLNIVLSGAHPAWLEIYRDFPPVKAGEASHAEVQVDPAAPDGDSWVKLSSHLRYNAVLECSRCGAEGSVNIDSSFETEIRDLPTHLGDTLDLQATELDEYYFESDGGFDIAGIIRDQINAALPDRFFCEAAECQSAAESEEELVWSTDKDGTASSPFAGLLKN